ncbi:uncharacterized protein LOC119400533 [Rhipicephalus sanguineus]|uniref:uncharacterized protein LOC119400533 n=1 Tax=Rhipicephalus sanguineus TaxID=34632 RepID=UPI0020C4DBB2|nr:uncharacterized protein LOC119400533 [Rhipicephalus sanguineus]
MYLKRATVRGLVSVTLKGRWNVLRSNDKVDFFDRCVSNPSAGSFGSYTEVCPTKCNADNPVYQLTYSTEHASVLCLSPRSLGVFAYDNEDALAVKLCASKADGFPDLKFGIAVYDIDYDDYENQCASLNRFGRHSRLKQVKKVLDYMRLNLGESFNAGACVNYQR